MTPIDQIKAEIERRRKEFIDKGEQTFHDAEIIRRAVISDCNDLLSFIDTLPEQPVEIKIDNPNIEKTDLNIKVETRTDGTGDIDGKAMLYVANKSYKIGYRDGKSSKEQPASGDLEEEVKKWVYDVVYDLDGPALMGTSEYLSVEDVANIARHFAEWGAEHLKR